MVSDYRRAQNRIHDAKRRKEKPWRAWYATPLWQGRRDAQLNKQPLCERCLAQGLLVAATVANHKTPHRGDWTLFSTGELESACAPCHDGIIQAEERADPSIGVDADGRPTDPAHHWNVR